MARDQLRRRNIPGGYWVASDDPVAADEAISGDIASADVIHAALMSDGVARLVQTLELESWESLLNELRLNGPRAVIQHVRRIERSEADGTRWPRFKTSDDAAVVSMAVPKPLATRWKAFPDEVAAGHVVFSDGRPREVKDRRQVGDTVVLVIGEHEKPYRPHQQISLLQTHPPA